MNIVIKEYEITYIKQLLDIWNNVVMAGNAFPQTECLDEKSGDEFFKSQSFTGVAVDEDTNQVLGLYILHPNNIGRCSHICNASYAVKNDLRGQHIGEVMISHCKTKAKQLEFRILQFNAVVKTNYSALHLYKKLGFTKLGVIPNGFRLDNGEYEDIIPHYCEL